MLDRTEVAALDAAEEKRARKAERGLDTRMLEPWERYRALLDLVDQYTDYVEICDRKTRFALILLGALNAVNLLLAARPDLLNVNAPGLAPFVRAYVVFYGIGAVYCFVHAINVLRPRQWLTDTVNANPEGLRFMKEIIAQSPTQFRENWRAATVGQVWEETATHAQQMARISAAKYAALDHVFRGLSVLTALTTLFAGGLALMAVW